MSNEESKRKGRDRYTQTRIITRENWVTRKYHSLTLQPKLHHTLTTYCRLVTKLHKHYSSSSSSSSKLHIYTIILVIYNNTYLRNTKELSIWKKSTKEGDRGGAKYENTDTPSRLRENMKEKAIRCFCFVRRDADNVILLSIHSTSYLWLYRVMKTMRWCER